MKTLRFFRSETAFISVMLLLVGVLQSRYLPAQVTVSTSTGSIQGTVTDPSGAVISGAGVTITGKETGQQITKTTSSGGIYGSGALIPGTYMIRVEEKGYSVALLTLTVQVGQIASGNVQLTLGSEAQVVTVEAQNVQVNSEQATVQGVLTAQQIDELPVNGRNFLDLAQLEPGVQVQDGGTFDPTKNGFESVSMGGRAGRTARIEVDGVDISDENVGTTTQNVAASAIQEFQISQSTLDLSSELSSSGTVSVVTRSGSNAPHGMGFYNFRDKRAGNADAPGGQDLPFQRNNYGGRFGGPILRNKLFFFVDAEHIKQDLFTPVLPSGQFASLASGFSTPYRDSEASARLDWQARSNVKMFYKFTYNNNSVLAPAGPNFSPFLNRNNTPSHALGFDSTTGSFNHSLRVAYSKFVNGIGDAVLGSSIYNPAPQVNIGFTDNTLTTGPSFLAPQKTIQSNLQTKYDGSRLWGTHTLRYGFTFNRIRGLSFASFFGVQPEVFSTTSAGAVGTLAGGASNPANYPVQFIIFGNGQGAFTEKAGFGKPAGALGDNRIEVYVGDGWKARTNLTVSYGLRYVRDTGREDSDLSPIPCSAINTTVFPNPPCSGNTQLLNQFGNVPGLGNRINQPNLNFAPQLGVAWDPWKRGKTVIRAGIGLYFDNTIFNSILFDRVVRLQQGLFNITPLVGCPNGTLTLPGSPSQTVSIASVCGQAIGTVAAQIGALQQQYQAATAAAGPSQNANFVGNTLQTAAGGVPVVFAPNYKSPRSVQMNIGFQHEITKGTVISVDYLRNVFTHYELGYDTNHVGDSRYLNIPNALAAISNTVGAACGGGAITQANASAAVQCYIASNPAADISDFAGNGLDSGAKFSGGSPGTAAFAGINPNVGINPMLFPVGRSVYDGLQIALRQNVARPFAGLKSLNLQVSYALSKFQDNIAGSAALNTLGDQDFGLPAVDYRNPTRYMGPSSQDRTHQFSFGAIVEFPHAYLPRLSVLGHLDSPLAATLYLPTTGGAGEIFQSDITGDGTTTSNQTESSAAGDILPGTNIGSFGRGVKASDLNRVINSYGASGAGKLTPSGEALVSAGLFTPSQLTTLNAVTPNVAANCGGNLNCIQLAPRGNVGLGWLRDIGGSASWSFKVGERFTIEPSFAAFNLLNFANFDSPANKLSSVLNNVPGNSLNATTAQNRTNRTGTGSGVFALGAPRQLEYGLRFVF